MTLPKHLPNGIEKVDANRIAVAPYNFVELPEKVVEVKLGDLPKRNFYHADFHTGYIDCTLTTSSPLYIRCGLTSEQFKADVESKDLPEFFYTNSESYLPVLPGSSLRGMLRAIVEIITCSKMTMISDQQKFFFRAVAAPADDPIGQQYKEIVNSKVVRAGYLVRQGDRWHIQPAKLVNKEHPFVWVSEAVALEALPNLVEMQDVKKYRPQYKNVRFDNIGIQNERPFAEAVSKGNKALRFFGTLVTSGNMLESSDDPKNLNRRNHCIVRTKDDKADLLDISHEAVDSYCKALTDFQRSKPFDEHHGVLEEDRCVFYCPPKTGKVVTLFGHSPNFRIPYSRKQDGKAASAKDFLPEYMWKPSQPDVIDMTEAIFGFVRPEKQEESETQARAGRVFITDAQYHSRTGDLWFSEQPITPCILSGSKPTTFQHYLVQPDVEKPKLKHYASNGTAIRGHKLYWHQGKSPNIDHPDVDNASKTQTTKISPIDAGVSFKFSLHFENLNQIELGALLWTLAIGQDEKYRLSLGMGKPLGMGAVKIVLLDLWTSDRAKRYQSLFQDDNWKAEETKATITDVRQYITVFEEYMCKELEIPSPLESNQRIQSFLNMLSWDETLNPTAKYYRRYMEIERDKKQHHVAPKETNKKNKKPSKTVNEYSDRPVLPSPQDVMKLSMEKKIIHRKVIS